MTWWRDPEPDDDPFDSITIGEVCLKALALGLAFALVVRVVLFVVTP